MQQVPAVMAVVGGQPVPLFEGAATEAQVRQVFDQLLALAAQQGVTGRLTITGDGAEAGGGEEAEEPPLPPLHQEAYDAIERDDLDARRGGVPPRRSPRTRATPRPPPAWRRSA